MRGWAERMDIDIAKMLDADIATAIWSDECYDPKSMWFRWEIFELDTWFKRWMLGFLKMKWKFFNSKKLTEKYDTIFFSNEAISGIWKTRSWTKTYYYAHSISRHLFDQREVYLAKVPLLVRPFFLLFSVFLRQLYRWEIARIDTVFVNSRSNQKRISEWLGRDDAIVIYPGVDSEKFDIFDPDLVSQKIAIEWLIHINKDYLCKEISQKQEAQGRENFSKWAYEWISDLEKYLSDEEIRSFSDISYKEYYISFSRLTHAKRVDSIIRVFQNIPDKKVVILYGENDSQKDEFMRLGEWYPNILFHKLTDNNHLPYIINGSIASICVSKDEDFGMVAIESMACGVPVIAVDEWWYRESIIDWRTGYLIDPTELEHSLKEKIRSIDISAMTDMIPDCRKRALEFSTQVVEERLREYMQ